MTALNPKRFYTTRDLFYRDATGGFGISAAFPGTYAAQLLHNPRVYFIAERVKYQPGWSVSAKIEFPLRGIQKPCVNIVPVIEGISEMHAKQLLYCFQDEQMRLLAMSCSTKEEVIPSYDLCPDILLYQGKETPEKIDDGIMVSDSYADLIDFPYVITTQQVLTNFNKDEFAHQNFEDESASFDDDDEDEFDPNFSEEMNDPDGLTYRPMDNVNLQDLSSNIQNRTYQKLIQNMDTIRTPSQFIAQYSCATLPTLDVVSDRRTKLKYQNEGAWKIFSVEGLWITEIMQSKSLQETVQVLKNLEHTILKPALDADETHELFKESYGYHYSRWQNSAAQIDETHKNFGYTI